MSPNLNSWRIITGEYPPDPGGVSDYTRHVAFGLHDANQSVEIWTAGYSTDVLQDEQIPIYRMLGDFGHARLVQLERRLNDLPQSVLLVQYVPQAFAQRGMNLYFAKWLAKQTRHKHDIRVMFHEVAFPFVAKPFRHNLVAIANRWMVRKILRAKPKIYTSTECWHPILKRYAPTSVKPRCIPIPSNIPKIDSPRIALNRSRFTQTSSATRVVGHFGTFGPSISNLMLSALTSAMAGFEDLAAVFIGRGAIAAQSELIRRVPGRTHHVFAVENACDEEVSCVIQATDVMLQPYPDGITTRRTSAMAGLVNGVAVVSNLGHLAESFWATADWIWVAQSPSAELLAQGVLDLARNEGKRKRIAERGEIEYSRRFSLCHTIEELLKA